MDGRSDSSDNDAFDDITSIEDGDSSVASRPQTSTRTRLTTELRPRKSVSQLKQEVKVGHAEKVVESNISNPEVKNTVKDIITLLRGLDSIGGGSSDTGEDEDEDEIYIGKLGHQDGVGTTQSSGNSGSRAIRVSNVIVKYEDPHYTKFTFETFDSDYTRKKAEGKEKDVHNVSSSIRSRNNTSSSITNNNNHKKSIVSFDQNFNERQAEVIPEKKSVHFSKDKPPSSSRSTLNSNSLKSNSKLFPVGEKKSTKSKVGIGINKKSLISTDIQAKNRHYANEELAQTAKLFYGKIPNNDPENEKDEEIRSNILRSTSSSSIISQDNEETFYSYSHRNRVYKEPALTFFLPSLVENDDGTRRELNLRGPTRSTGVVKRETSHIGAPFFRLDGSVVEDVNLTRPINKIDIRKYVRAAVQQQQSVYEEVTENARELKKRVTKNDASRSPSITGTNNRKYKP